MSALAAIIILGLVFCAVLALQILRTLLTDEARAWLPYIATHLVRAAARRLPRGHRERYQEEWLAELEAYSDRPLTALARAISLRLGVQALMAELSRGEAPETRVSLMDRLFAAVVLIYSAPVLVLIAVMIKLTSPGPVLSVTWGVRRDGARFRQLAFRTTVASDRPGLPISTARGTLEGSEAVAWLLQAKHYLMTPVEDRIRPQVSDDAVDAYFDVLRSVYERGSRALHRGTRVTTVGRFLRRYGFDRLPGLLNVVRGNLPMPYPWRAE